MGILNDIFDASLVGQRFQRLRDNEYAREKDLEDREMKKQKLEHLLKSPADSPEVINQIFNQTGEITPETVNALRAQSPIPVGMEGLTLDQAKDFSDIKKNTAMADAYSMKDDLQVEKENRTEERQLAKEKRIQDYKLQTEERAQDRRDQKALSGEAAKVSAIATTIIPEIEQLKNAFRGNYKGALWGITSGTNRQLSKLVDQVADKVGRLRSGGAINKDEEARFKRQIASVADLGFGNANDAIAALDGIIAEANEVTRGIKPRTSAQYKSPLAVKEAVAKGEITVDQGKEIVRSQFGFK